MAMPVPATIKAREISPEESYGSQLRTKEDVRAGIAAIENGTVTFVGAYHENRQKKCLEALKARR